jgi:hypothetical protein
MTPAEYRKRYAARLTCIAALKQQWLAQSLWVISGHRRCVRFAPKADLAQIIQAATDSGTASGGKGFFFMSAKCQKRVS